jgi:proline-specific peptidase
MEPTVDTSGIPYIDGRIPFKGYSTWYRVYGEAESSGRLPLLCLHGGPGGCYDGLEPLKAMVATGRRVIFYDQLGCGLSSLPERHPEMWTVDLYIEEVETVRRALGLDQVHLLGASWGGMLAMSYMLTRPEGIASLTLASSPASIPQWVAEANRLREKLPSDVQAALLKHEADGTFEDPEYVAATRDFYRRHVCRLDPYPDFLQRIFDKVGANPEVYDTMNGPSEFHVIGTLSDWDVRNRLDEIDAPTLVTSGRYDEATEVIAGTVHDGIRGSEWVVFEESSHFAHAEEPERYLQVLGEFLARHD